MPKRTLNARKSVSLRWLDSIEHYMTYGLVGADGLVGVDEVDLFLDTVMYNDCGFLNEASDVYMTACPLDVPKDKWLVVGRAGIGDGIALRFYSVRVWSHRRASFFRKMIPKVSICCPKGTVITDSTVLVEFKSLGLRCGGGEKSHHGSCLYAFCPVRWSYTLVWDSDAYSFGAKMFGIQRHPPDAPNLMSIRIACGMWLHRERDWVVKVRCGDAPSLRIATNAKGALDACCMRDLPAGMSRRDALLHWVAGHSRLHASDKETEIEVRRHLRGRDKFDSHGMVFEIVPSVEDERRWSNLDKQMTARQSWLGLPSA